MSGFEDNTKGSLSKCSAFDVVLHVSSPASISRAGFTFQEEEIYKQAFLRTRRVCCSCQAALLLRSTTVSLARTACQVLGSYMNFALCEAETTTAAAIESQYGSLEVRLEGRHCQDPQANMLEVMWRNGMLTTRTDRNGTPRCLDLKNCLPCRKHSSSVR